MQSIQGYYLRESLHSLQTANLNSRRMRVAVKDRDKTKWTRYGARLMNLKFNDSTQDILSFIIVSISGSEKEDDPARSPNTFWVD